MKLHSLTEKFLAAFPVIGPHADIEGELMLAGQKPIALFDVFTPHPNDDFERKKMCYDRLRMDQAVTNGTLVSADREITQEDGESFTMRFFAQPEKEQEMLEFADGYNSGAGLTKSHGAYLGYRKRDICLFRATSILPEPIEKSLINLNTIFQRAYSDKQLKNAGIEEPNAYFEELKEQLEGNDIA